MVSVQNWKVTNFNNTGLKQDNLHLINQQSLLKVYSEDNYYILFGKDKVDKKSTPGKTKQKKTKEKSLPTYGCPLHVQWSFWTGIFCLLYQVFCYISTQ